jgi:hypothetical protein
MKNRTELDAALDALARQLPSMIADNPNASDFRPEFAGAADEICEHVSAADCEHVHARIDAILESIHAGAAH